MYPERHTSNAHPLSYHNIFNPHPHSAWPLQEIAVRERELREEETAELARERQEAARRKVARDAERKAEEAEAKFLREKQVALALEVRNRCKRKRRFAECRFRQQTRE